MSALEHIAEQDLSLGMKLMLVLYPIARRIYAHDVADTIELWLENEGSAELASFVDDRARLARPRRSTKDTGEVARLAGTQASRCWLNA